MNLGRIDAVQYLVYPRSGVKPQGRVANVSAGYANPSKAGPA